MEGYQAHLDESSAIDAAGNRVYVMASVLSLEENAPALKGRLRSVLRRGQDHLHWAADRSIERRIELAGAIADCEITGALITTRLTTNREQERARKKILESLLPRLQWNESVSHVCIESRHQGDVHDVKTVAWLRRSHAITAQMHIDHVPKRQDERLWVADAIVSAYVASRCHAQAEPWGIITDQHAIDIVELKP